MAFLTPVLIVIGDNTDLLWPITTDRSATSRWTIFNGCVGIGIIWAIVAKPRILNHSFSIWLGVLSFSAYIWHMPLTDPASASLSQPTCSSPSLSPRFLTT